MVYRGDVFKTLFARRWHILFFDAVEPEYRFVLLLSDKYLTSYQSFVSAVHEHFGDIVLARN